jgi:hypothetical protein
MALGVARTLAYIQTLPIQSHQQERVVRLEQWRQAALAHFADVVIAYAVPTEPLGRHDALSFVAPATPAAHPIWPNTLANTGIAGLMGVMIAFAMAVLLERRRPRRSQKTVADEPRPAVLGDMARERGRR